MIKARSNDAHDVKQIMSESKGSKSYRVIELLYEKPWILPFIITMLTENRYFTAKEIAEAWGTRTSIVKRGLWWLIKYGLAEKLIREVTKYKLKEGVIPSLEELLREYWVSGNRLVIKRGRIYFVITVRKRKVLVRNVDEDTVKKVKEAFTTYKEEGLSVIAQTIGLHPKIISTALKVLKVKGEM